MRTGKRSILLSSALAMGGLIPAARAQFAVIDVGAIVQLVKEVATLQQQLQTAENQLTQAQMQFQSMTGNRGMQNLLSGTDRNYLPSTWAQLQAAVTQTGGAYGALSTGIQGLITENSVLTPAQMAMLPPSQQIQLQEARASAATLQMTSRQAMQETSARFASLQQLIAAIPTATDQKGALDLQARIQAEQAMLQNENTKLNVMYQSAQGDSWAREAQLRELAIAGVGSLRNLPPLNLP
jgi:type IV secretion system protein VirB5